MRRLKFHPPGPKKSNARIEFFSKIGEGGINKNTLHNRKKIPCVLAVAWYTASMIKNQYSTAELTAALGNPYFVGLNLRVWRVATKRGAYEFKAQPHPKD
jgi:hypothetical protein